MGNPDLESETDWNLDGSFQFDLEVRNLLGREYRAYLSRYKEFALDPGRNVIVRVSTSL